MFRITWNRVRLTCAVLYAFTGVGAACVGALPFASMSFTFSGLCFAFSD